MQDKRKYIEEILMSNNVVGAITNNLEGILEIIPEIKYIIGFKHNHPHHHLDVWNHTLECLSNIDEKDLELRFSALLHDIGKPFSYQDEEVRHFRGHAEISYKISEVILTRLEYNEKFITDVSYLIKMHDTIIEPDNLDNNIKLVEKRLKLQYADAKAHNPDKIAKRLNMLDEIKNDLKKKFSI